MNCLEAREMIHPYVDDELELVKTLEIEKHIRECAACAAVHRNIAALGSSMRDGSLYYRAPAGLERRIRSEVRRGGFLGGKWVGKRAGAGGGGSLCFPPPVGAASPAR